MEETWKQTLESPREGSGGGDRGHGETRGTPTLPLTTADAGVPPPCLRDPAERTAAPGVGCWLNPRPVSTQHRWGCCGDGGPVHRGPHRPPPQACLCPPGPLPPPQHIPLQEAGTQHPRPQDLSDPLVPLKSSRGPRRCPSCPDGLKLPSWAGTVRGWVPAWESQGLHIHPAHPGPGQPRHVPGSRGGEVKEPRHRQMPMSLRRWETSNALSGRSTRERLSGTNAGSVPARWASGQLG